MTDAVNEFPNEWFAEAKLSSYLHNPSLNYFGVSAGQPLSVWRKKGWIYPDDPRGWFQWYCRYYFGRRIHEEDARQIRRWKAMGVTFARLKRIANPTICAADGGNDRRFSSGLMTVEESKVGAEM
jgi:hypothetical protein